MNIRKLAEGLYVSPQLNRADVQAAASLGIGSVVCNRPDGEEEGQPAFGQVAQWLSEAGIAAEHQPVQAAAIGVQDAAQFRALLQKAQKPVLAYCRTGTRSALLWALYQAGNGMGVEQAVAAAAQAGIDLGCFEPRLREAAEQGGRSR